LEIVISPKYPLDVINYYLQIKEKSKAMPERYCNTGRIYSTKIKAVR